MQTTWFDHLNSWNPQLVREWRGRLKTRNVVAAIALSVIAQMLLCLVQFQGLSFQTPQEQWFSIWQTLTSCFPYVLFSLGGYYIVSDITQEEKRGTLNFIRLSPRPGWQILLGKMLGVPILPYITIASAVPLHVLSAVQADVSLGLIVSYYVLLFGSCLFCYSLALLSGLVGGGAPKLLNRQATASVSFGILAFFILSPSFLGWNWLVPWQSFRESNEWATTVHWSFISLTGNPLIAHGFTIANLAIATALLWRVLLRRFRQPRSTLLSKRQSYGFVAYIEILIIGFALNPSFGDLESGAMAASAFGLYASSILLISVVMFSTVPSRQALLDWSRYQSRDLQSWLWSDKSPMPLALGLNLLLIYGLLIPWTFASSLAIQYPLGTLVSFLSIAMTVIMAGVLTQIIFAMRIRNPTTWAVGILLIWFTVPPAVMGLLGLIPENIGMMATFWTLFGYPVWHFENPLALSFTFIGMVFQGIVLILLVWQFSSILRRLHQS